MDDLLPPRTRELRSSAEGIARDCLAPRAEQVDRDCLWPEHSMRALAEHGLTGLHVPERLGGHEQGMMGLAAITEALAKACTSSAMCFGMHCVATAVIAAKATRHQEDAYLRPIAEGKHLTSLALSEAGTGAHFYLPETTVRRENGVFTVHGEKQFVTNGGHADSYVVSTVAGAGDLDRGTFSCLIMDRDRPGMTWREPWRGFGLRGNASRSLGIESVQVPAENLLGEEGDQIWYAFEVVSPYFLIAMAGTYLGVAQVALDITIQHLRTRRYSHSGETLANSPVLQTRIADMWTALQKTRYLTYHAARMGDLGDPKSLVAILTSKADVSETATWILDEAMTLCGGTAYRENGQLSRLMRDARASHVMSPTTDLLKLWAGRSLLELPML